MFLLSQSRSTRFLMIAAFALLATLSASAQANAKYTYFRVGNKADVSTKTQPGFALIGGGEDLDAAFQWMCQKSGGGDFLVLRATGTDAYNPYIKDLCHQNSVATLVIPSRAAAEDPFVANAIRNAEAIFISGGDQANYINFWKGTTVQKLLNEALLKGVPIGGTSAGLAVQGEYIYTAQNDPPDGPDLSSKLALNDPFYKQVVVERGFLLDPALKGTITDTHFDTRERMGRLLVFMARILASAPSIKAVGVDEQTAVLMEPDGHSTVVGHGAVYFLNATKPATVLKQGVPLSFADISVKKVIPGGKFDLHSWSGDSVDYSLSVLDGAIHSTQSNGKAY